MRIYEFNVKMV